MQQVSIPQTYSAFLSYSRHDEAHAQWLQNRLSDYRFPSRLEARPLVAPAAANRLAPVFRDRSALSAAPDLGQALERALVASGHLIVLCTPSAAGSAWVNREIEMFQQAGRSDFILPALFEGDEHSAFPPALRHDGSGQAVTPLAADFRQAGDGPRLALLKLLAELAGVPLGTLIGREESRRQRRLAAVVGGSIAGMAVFAGISGFALAAKAEAERERARSEQLVETLVIDLRAAVKPMGSLDLLDKVNEAALGYFGGQSVEDLPEAALEQRAQLLLAMGEDELTRGRPTIAEIHFGEAHKAMAARFAEQPDDPDHLFDLAQAEYWLGYAAWQSGKPATAKTHFQRYADLARALVERDPSRRDWQIEAGSAAVNLGMIALRQSGDGKTAEPAFLEALGHFRTAAGNDRADPQLAGEIANALAWLADAHRAQGETQEARAKRTEQLAVIEAGLGTSPRNMVLRSERLSARLALARLMPTAQAGPEFRALRTEALAIARADPENADAAQQVRVIELLKAQSLLQGGPPYDPSLAAIAQTIGTCRPLSPALAVEELEELCRLNLARLQLARGNSVYATELARSVTQEASGKPRLSEKWGIDFAAEAGAVLAEADRAISR
jgi:hypothetical protein